MTALAEETRIDADSAAETPLRRILADFLASKLAIAGLATLAGIVFVAAIVGMIVYTTFSLGSRVRGEICMEFNGRTVCKTVSGDTREHVLQTGVSNACENRSLR